MGLASVYPGVSDSNLPLVFSWLCCYLCSFPRERRSGTGADSFKFCLQHYHSSSYRICVESVQLLSCLISISFFIILMAIAIFYMPFLELSSFKQLPARWLSQLVLTGADSFKFCLQHYHSSSYRICVEFHPLGCPTALLSDLNKFLYYPYGNCSHVSQTSTFATSSIYAFLRTGIILF
jgi:hypothetical protein